MTAQFTSTLKVLKQNQRGVPSSQLGMKQSKQRQPEVLLYSDSPEKAGGDQDRNDEAYFDDERKIKPMKSSTYHHHHNLPDELLEIKDEDVDEEEDYGDGDSGEKKSLGGGRDRDSGVSSLKSFRVTSPNGGLEGLDGFSTPPENNPIKSPVSTPSDHSASSSSYIIRKPAMVRTNTQTIKNTHSTELDAILLAGGDNPIKKHTEHNLGEVPQTSSSSASVMSRRIPKMPTSRISKMKPTVNGLTSTDSSYSMKPGSNTSVMSNSTTANIFPSDLVPLDNPSQGLSKGLQHLNSSDWETNIEGFRLLVALVRFHPEYIRSDLHTVNMAGIKQLSNLRSQVSRSACLFFKEMFCHLGKYMEQDVEKIGEKLLDKSADTNKFIRESSCAALEAMVENLSPTKTIIPLENVGAKHRNSVVKTTTAKMSTVVIRKLGAERCLTQMGDRLLPMLVKFLQEGSLETRTHAKAAISMLMSHGYFDTALRTHVPPDSLRHVIKGIDAIKNELLRKHHPDNGSKGRTVRW